MTEDSSRRATVLFVCIGNMIRSQMAEGFARHNGDSLIEAYSAGLNPTGIVAQEAIRVMNDIGIDISEQISKGLADVPLQDMDYVVNISGYSGAFIPPSFEGRVIEWPVEDPLGKPVEEFVTTRDDIGARVKELIGKIWKDRSTPTAG